MKPIAVVENLSKRYRIGASRVSYDTFGVKLAGEARSRRQRSRLCSNGSAGRQLLNNARVSRRRDKGEVEVPHSNLYAPASLKGSCQLNV